MKRYETVNQAKERTNLSRSSLMRFDKPGITIRVGRAIRFDVDALDKALTEAQEAADGFQED